MKVSVVIPTYNRAAMLAEALDSAVKQERPPDEIVVVDDGSKDNSEEVARKFGPTIKYIRQTNAGPSAARNNGFRHATGDFIALLDSDDLWPVHRLSRQLATLEWYPALDFLCGIEAHFSEVGHFRPVGLHDRALETELKAAKIELNDPFSLLLRENFVPTSSVLFRRELLNTVGFIDENLRQAEDYDFWLRFALAGARFGYLDEVLCYRRQHAGNLVKEWVNRTTSTIAVLERYQDRATAEPDRLKERLSGLYYDLGSRHLYGRDFKRAHHCLTHVRARGTRRLVCSVKRNVSRLLS